MINYHEYIDKFDHVNEHLKTDEKIILRFQSLLARSLNSVFLI